MIDGYCEVCGVQHEDGKDCEPLADVQARIDALNEKLKPFFDSLPDAKWHHLTCGWSGDQLTPEGKCPQCGEYGPWWSEAGEEPSWEDAPA